MRAPVVSAHGSVDARPLILVSLTGEDGVTGYGEAAPLRSYDGVGSEDVVAALEDCRQILAGMSADSPRAAILAACTRVAVLPQAVAAIDLALWDLEGRRAGLPVWRLLGVGAPEAIEVNASLAAPDRSGAATAAAEARQAGFRCVKVKVGVGDDAGRLAAVRAFAGPAMAIRVDANGGWSVEEAVAALRGLGPVGIELCEEPASGVAAIAEVAAQVPVAVALDESVRQPGALDAPGLRRRLPEGLRCGRDQRGARALRAEPARWATRCTSPRPTTGPWASPPRCTRPRRSLPTAPAAWPRWGCSTGAETPWRRCRPDVDAGGSGLGDGLVDWYRDG